MKNILYVGPYRHDTVNGLMSRIIINNIINSSEIALSTRPLYIDSNPVLNQNLDIFEKEKTKLSHYDVIIQHSSINYAQTINQIKTNIIIPILDNTCINNTDIGLLSAFDKILVDNNFDYSVCSRWSKIKNKVQRFDYNLPNINNIASINIGIYQQYNKIYNIIDYNEDQILDTVVAFNMINQNQDYVLLFFIEDANNDQLSRINQLISEICKTTNHEKDRSKINTFKLTPTMDSLFAIGKSMDIYLNTGHKSIYTKIAKNFNKTIIDFDLADTHVSSFKNHNYYDSGVFTLSPITIKNKLLSKQLDNNKHYKLSHIGKLL